MMILRVPLHGTEMALQETAGMRGFAGGHHFRRTCNYDLAPGMAAFGAEVNDVVCGFDDIHVMLDRKHSVSGVDQAMQAVEQPLNICEMKTSSRFVENVERVLGPLQLTQFRGELDALGLTTG